MSKTEIHEQLKAHGLLQNLREFVGAKRYGKIPSRDTIHRAFKLDPEKESVLHRLIILSGKEILDTLPVAIK